MIRIYHHIWLVKYFDSGDTTSSAVLPSCMSSISWSSLLDDMPRLLDRTLAVPTLAAVFLPSFCGSYTRLPGVFLKVAMSLPQIAKPSFMVFWTCLQSQYSVFY